MSIIVNRVLASESVSNDPKQATGALEALTVAELKALAADEGVSVSKGARKASIIAAIEAHRGR